MAYFNTKRICEIYTSEEDGIFVFPELKENIVDPNNIAIANSGGGNRSLSSSIGYFRSLERNYPGFLERVSYLSGISGGSWFNTIVGYTTIDPAELFGKDIPIYDINRETLNSVNFEEESYFIGDVAVNCPFLSTFSKAARTVVPEKMYEYVCSELFLKKYGLQYRVPVIDEFHVRLNREFNKIMCIAKPETRPFVITTGCVLDNDLIDNRVISPAIEYTPMYTGVRVKNHKYGGLLFGNQGFSCDFKKLDCYKDQVTRVKLQRCMGNTQLETGIAASAAAYSADVFEMGGSFIGDILGLLNLKSNLWGYESSGNDVVHLSDGTFHDYTGIVPLLARGCKKIISFVNCKAYGENYCKTGLTHLFGIEPSLKCKYSEYRLNSQVFHVSDWVNLRERLEYCTEEKILKYHRAKLEVMPNKELGINGGYETDIIFVILSPDREFIEQLNIDLNAQEFENISDFPNFQLLFEKEGRLIEMTKQHINIQTTYTSWCMDKIIREQPDFFTNLEA